MRRRYPPVPADLWHRLMLVQPGPPPPLREVAETLLASLEAASAADPRLSEWRCLAPPYPTPPVDAGALEAILAEHLDMPRPPGGVARTLMLNGRHGVERAALHVTLAPDAQADDGIALELLLGDGSPDNHRTLHALAAAWAEWLGRSYGYAEPPRVSSIAWGPGEGARVGWITITPAHIGDLPPLPAGALRAPRSGGGHIVLAADRPDAGTAGDEQLLADLASLLTPWLAAAPPSAPLPSVPPAWQEAVRPARVAVRARQETLGASLDAVGDAPLPFSTRAAATPPPAAAEPVHASTGTLDVEAVMAALALEQAASEPPPWSQGAPASGRLGAGGTLDVSEAMAALAAEDAAASRRPPRG